MYAADALRRVLRTGLLGFFVGKFMAASKGRAKPELVKRLVEERVGE